MSIIPYIMNIASCGANRTRSFLKRKATTCRHKTKITRLDLSGAAHPYCDERELFTAILPIGTVVRQSEHRDNISLSPQVALLHNISHNFLEYAQFLLNNDCADKYFTDMARMEQGTHTLDNAAR
jgi:hypothetical protein